MKKLLLSACLAGVIITCVLHFWPKPSFNAHSLDGSYFSLWLGRKGYLHLQWSDVPESTKHAIISWLPDMCSKCYPSIVSYAPGLIIHAEGFEVNFIGDTKVINFDSRFGTRKNRFQIAGKATKIEEEIKSEISKLIIGRGVEAPPFSKRQKRLTHLRRDSSCKNKDSTYDKLFNFHNPLTVLKCSRSVSPDKRTVLDKQVLPGMIPPLFEDLMKTGRKARMTYVCCEYFFQNPDGEIVGILTDDKTQIVQGFDIGRRLDALDIHSRAMHEVILLDDEENQRKAYSLLVGLFQNNNRESP